MALVTGGARRLGAAVARRLSAGFDLAIHYNMSARDAESLAAELRDAGGGRVVTIQGDFAAPEAAAGVVAAAASSLGPLDLVVNSASSFEYDDPERFDAAHMQSALAVNLVAPLVVAREFARRCTPRAVLVDILDNKVLAPNPDFFSYSLAKFALKASVDMLAMHYRGRMRVNAIAPGVTLRSGEQSQANFERGWRRTLTGSGPTPEDIAAAVMFIWQTASMNGATIVLDGGQRLMSLERDVAFLEGEE